MKIFNHFEHLSLTNDQTLALKKISMFLENDDDIFILNGYAGSGKTTILKGIVDYLTALKRDCQLMAPTGRASKVIIDKTKKPASTIHKGIYSFENLKEVEIEKEKGKLSFLYYFQISENKRDNDAVFIVDEASMVSDKENKSLEFFRFGSGFLLKDLIEYSGVQTDISKAKIIFVGDKAQLPPVGMSFSPALDKKYLEGNYSLSVSDATIKEVKRQSKDNGILKASINLRQSLKTGFYNNFDLRENAKDIFNPKFEDFINKRKSVEGKKIVITYQNKIAKDINRDIRIDKYGNDCILQETDQIIIGVNNYNIGVLNGEFGVVTKVDQKLVSRVVRYKKKGGNGEVEEVQLNWRKVEVVIPDFNGNTNAISAYVLENYLYADSQLTEEEQRAIYVDFKIRNAHLKENTQAFKEAISSDEFFNALKLKYGYAVTCHKAQGGEWDNAFVFWDRGAGEGFKTIAHNTNAKTNSDFYRWAYTAITRGSKKLYCINPPYFNSYKNISILSENIQDALQELTDVEVKAIEISPNDEVFELIKKFGLTDEVLEIQNHFIKSHYQVKKQAISIVNWKKLNYEIRYYFEKGNETSAIKFFVNGKNKFKENYLDKINNATNSDELFNKVCNLINEPLNFVVKRNTIETIETQIDFDIKTEETKPFLKKLFEDLLLECKKLKINISNLEHFEYRERYTFNRVNENAVIDVEYDKKGFFGRILFLEKKSNGVKLLQDLKIIFEHLKNQDNVI